MFSYKNERNKIKRKKQRVFSSLCFTVTRTSYIYLCLSVFFPLHSIYVVLDYSVVLMWFSVCLDVFPFIVLYQRISFFHHSVQWMVKMIAAVRCFAFSCNNFFICKRAACNGNCTCEQQSHCKKCYMLIRDDLRGDSWVRKEKKL